jgi:putative peptidoglycan binding protein
MPPLFGLFLDRAPWLAVLAVLTWIAYTRLASVPDGESRWAKALSQPWLMKTAVVLALLSWTWSFGRLYTDDAYLPGAGTFAELSTVLLVLVLVLAGVAWLGIRRWARVRPWLTQLLVVALIFAAAALLRDMPEKVLSSDKADDEDRPVIAYIQGRLIHLGCFKAVGEPDRRDGTFDPLTTLAIIEFQQANGLLQEPKIDEEAMGVIRPGTELRLLARPFPFLLGPKPCPGG